MQRRVNYNIFEIVIHAEITEIMRSTITERGQTVIPAAIRRKLGLTPADRLEWVVTSEGIQVIPVKRDPIEALRGRGRGGSVDRLIEDRRADAMRE